MKKALIGLATAAALTVAAGAAYANGYGYGSAKDTPIAAPQANWNGLYIGAAVGYGIADTQISGKSYTFNWLKYGFWESNLAGTAAKGVSSDGAQGTLTLGYDRQIHPGLLVGIFGDYTFGGLKNEAELAGYSAHGWLFFPFSAHPELAYLQTEIDNSWSIGGRIGLIRGSTLWYAFGGYTQADLDWDHAVLIDGELAGGGSGSKKLKGYFLGLGVEQHLFQNLSLKLEYRYTNYDKIKFGTSYGWDFDSENHYSEFRADPDVHTVRLGLNWKVDLFHGHHAHSDPLK